MSITAFIENSLKNHCEQLILVTCKFTIDIKMSIITFIENSLQDISIMNYMLSFIFCIKYYYKNGNSMKPLSHNIINMPTIY